MFEICGLRDCVGKLAFCRDLQLLLVWLFAEQVLKVAAPLYSAAVGAPLGRLGLAPLGAARAQPTPEPFRHSEAIALRVQTCWMENKHVGCVLSDRRLLSQCVLAGARASMYGPDASALILR